MRPDPRGLIHDDEEGEEEQKNEKEQEKVVKKVKKGGNKAAKATTAENGNKAEVTNWQFLIYKVALRRDDILGEWFNAFKSMNFVQITHCCFICFYSFLCVFVFSCFVDNFWHNLRLVHFTCTYSLSHINYNASSFHIYNKII